jgi:hypothetical protein
MARKTGYLACALNTPPLIFRFQFNPDILSEKKSYKYDPVDFGKWSFSEKSAGAGLGADLSALLSDAKELGARLIKTKPLEAKEGQERSFSIDFSLDASRPGEMDGDDHYGGSIEPDLWVLRSFMNPSLDLIDFATLAFSGFKKMPDNVKPPECSLVYGGLSVTCVMTDLNIKITAFQDDGTPLRADVSVTLKEQPRSLSPLTEFIQRQVGIVKSYNRSGFGDDVMAVTPGLNLFT